MSIPLESFCYSATTSIEYKLTVAEFRFGDEDFIGPIGVLECPHFPAHGDFYTLKDLTLMI